MTTSRDLKILGAVLALLHFIVSWVVILGWIPRTRPDAMWQMAWLPLFILDLPLSAVCMLAVRLIPDWQAAGLPFPMSDFREYLAPAFFHGVIGPMWYAIAPTVIWKSWRRLRGNAQTA